MAYAYHVTTEKYLGSIAIQGLKPSKTWGVVFFSKEEFAYPPMAYCHGALLRFPVPANHKQDDNYGSLNSEEFVTNETIHPGLIGILTEDGEGHGYWMSLESFMADKDARPFQENIPGILDKDQL